MGIDILLAALFLVLTAISVPALLTGANLFYELFGWRIFIWEIYLEAAERAPFSEGLAVTIMLLTTLIPTALHLLLAGAALLLPGMGGSRFAALAADEDPDPIARLWLVFGVAGSMVLSWIALVGLFIFGHGLLVAGFGAFGTSLAAMARWFGG